MTPFGDRLPHVRAAAGLTQNKLADRMGIKRSTIARIEGGDSVPKLMTMRRIIAALEPLVDVTPLREAMDPEQTSLAAQVARLTTQLEKMQTRYGAAMSRNEEYRRELDLMGANRPVETIVASSEPSSEPDEQYAVTDIELVRLRRLLNELRQDGAEDHAELICKVLNSVDRLRLEAERIAGMGTRRKGVAA